MRTRRACLLVAGSLLALTLAPPAEAKPRYLRVEVSVQGQQTATWSITDQVGECGTSTRSGTQTIAFESPRPARLSLRRFPRTDPRSGKRRGVTFFGTDVVSTNWTFTRTFQRSSPPPGCPPPDEEIVAAQTGGCGTQGPFEVPISVGWRGTALPSDPRTGTVELRGILDRNRPGQRTPNYSDCEYDGTHIADLLHSKGRLSQGRLTSGRTIRVKVSAGEKLPESESGSQTTTLTATVTLRRLR